MERYEKLWENDYRDAYYARKGAYIIHPLKTKNTNERNWYILRECMEYYDDYMLGFYCEYNEDYSSYKFKIASFELVANENNEAEIIIRIRGVKYGESNPYYPIALNRWRYPVYDGGEIKAMKTIRMDYESFCKECDMIRKNYGKYEYMDLIRFENFEFGNKDLMYASKTEEEVVKLAKNCGDWNSNEDNNLQEK